MKGSWQEKRGVQGKENKETAQKAAETVRECRLEKSVANTKSISKDLYKPKQAILAPSFIYCLVKE